MCPATDAQQGICSGLWQCAGVGWHHAPSASEVSGCVLLRPHLCSDGWPLRRAEQLGDGATAWLQSMSSRTEMLRVLVIDAQAYVQGQGELLKNY